MRGLAYFLGTHGRPRPHVQVAMNSQLRKVLQSANSAALVSFLVGALALVALSSGHAQRRCRRAKRSPRCRYGPGSAGCSARSMSPSSTVVAAELGATSLLALALAGQLATALVIDHFGWLGMPENPITWTRRRGVVLLGIGSLAHRALKPSAPAGRLTHLSRGLRPCANRRIGSIVLLAGGPAAGRAGRATTT